VAVAVAASLAVFKMVTSCNFRSWIQLNNSLGN
jgi:hypothetical protein